jgi:hypothetical protein
MMPMKTRTPLPLRLLPVLPVLGLIVACGASPPPPAQAPAAPPAPSASAAASAPSAPSVVPRASTPAAAVTGLYDSLVALGLRGAPRAEQLAQLSPWLGAELTDLLRRARELHDTAAREAPGEKPPFNDGDLFSSLFEGPSSFTVLEPAAPAADGRQRVPVRFSYGTAADATTWTDQVVVRREGEAYVVVDVGYGGDWDFANRSSLVTALQSALAPVR